MGVAEGKSHYRAFSLRKRKRNYSPAPSYNNEGLLALENPQQKDHSTSRINSQDNVPDDSKVVNSIKKLGVKIAVKDKQKQLNIIILLSTTEADYFESMEDELSTYLKQNMDVSGIAISKPATGSVDRFFFIYGDIISISRAAVYITFILNAKINNFIPNESYTLKSPNYKVNLLLEGSYDDPKSYSDINKAADNCGLREFDISSPYTYNSNDDLISIRLKGDFNALFNFFLLSVDKSSAQGKNKYTDNSKINQSKVINVFDNAGLFQEQEKNKGVLDNQVNNVLEYIYSRSFLNPASSTDGGKQ